MRRRKATRLFLIGALISGIGLLAGRGLLRPNPYAPTQNGFTFAGQSNVEQPRYLPATPPPEAPKTLYWEPVRVGPVRGFRIIPHWYAAPYSTHPTVPRENRPRAPWYPALAIGLPPELSRTSFACRTLRAEAVSSTGDIFPLAVAGDEYQIVSPVVFISLPPVGVPASYRWIDVTLRRRDTNQLCGTWRVFDLPRLRHAVRPEEAGQGSVFVPVPGAASGKGIQVDAQAWQTAPRPDVLQPDAGRYTLYLFERSVEAEVRAQADPLLFHTPYEAWDVRIKSLVPEWDAPDRLASGNFAPNSKAALYYRTGKVAMRPADKVSGADALFWAAPTPTVQRVARINAELVRCERLDEDVTFADLSFLPLPDGHVVFNLPNGVKTVTTPSGVRVTLHALPERSYFWWRLPVNRNDRPVEVPYMITVQPASEAGFADLPRSPLLRKNGPPVQLSLSLSIGSGGRDSQTEAHIRAYSDGYQTGPPIPGRKRGEFTIDADQLQKRLTFGFRITQERTHETVPVTLTVPVQAQPPARRLW